MKFRRYIAGVAVGVLALALLLPARARAATCNGFIFITYPNGSGPFNIGDDVLTRITIGTGDITGGPLNVLRLANFFFNRACDIDAVGGITPNGKGIDPVTHFPLGCVEDPNFMLPPNAKPVMFDGIVPNSFHCVFGNQPDPNDNGDGSLFTPQGGPLQLPANAIGGACTVDFKQKITSLSGDSTPNRIEQLVGYHNAECDNDLLDSGNFQTAAIDIETPEVPYDCYQTKKSTLLQERTVDVADVFGNGSLTLTKLHRFCAPTNKNDEHPEFKLLPGHLAGYEFGSSSGTFNKPDGVTVATQFGTYTVNVGNPKRLLVPTAKDKNGPPPVNPLPPGTIRHFLCHDVNSVKGPKPKGTSVDDQFFALTVDTSFLGSSTLCAPVNKNGEEPDAVTDPNFLFCIDSKTKDSFPDTNLFFNNQFGPSDQQFAKTPFFESYDELCVPATVQIP